LAAVLGSHLRGEGFACPAVRGGDGAESGPHCPFRLHSHAIFGIFYGQGFCRGIQRTLGESSVPTRPAPLLLPMPAFPICSRR
jgi:hypothetical protein